jgi:serine/threonine protein kinase
MAARFPTPPYARTSLPLLFPELARLSRLDEVASLSTLSPAESDLLELKAATPIEFEDIPLTSQLVVSIFDSVVRKMMKEVLRVRRVPYESVAGIRKLINDYNTRYGLPKKVSDLNDVARVATIVYWALNEGEDFSDRYENLQNQIEQMYMVVLNKGDQDVSRSARPVTSTIPEYKSIGSDATSDPIAIKKFLGDLKLLKPETPTMCGYKIKKELGAGSFGQVSESEDLETRDDIAIKVQKIGTGRSKWQNFLREGSIQSAIFRPLPIYSSTGRRATSFETEMAINCPEDQSQSVITMPLGSTNLRDLKDSLLEFFSPSGSTQKKLIVREIVLKICYDMICDLYRIHGSRVIHNDLKPENVLIYFVPYYGGIKVEARIIDYGLSEYADGKRLAEGKQVGTIMYSSPEKMCGIYDYGQPADVWALGLIMAELLMNLELSDDEEYEVIRNQFTVSKDYNGNKDQMEKISQDMSDLMSQLSDRGKYKPAQAGICYAAASTLGQTIGQMLFESDRAEEVEGKLAESEKKKSAPIAEWMYDLQSPEMMAYLADGFYGRDLYNGLWEIIRGATHLDPTKRWTMKKIFDKYSTLPIVRDLSLTCPVKVFDRPFSAAQMAEQMKASINTLRPTLDADDLELMSFPEEVNRAIDVMAATQFREPVAADQLTERELQYEREIARMLKYRVNQGLYQRATLPSAPSAPSGAKRYRT